MVWLYVYLGLYFISFCITIFIEARSKKEITVDDVVMSMLCNIFLLGILLMISDFISYIDRKNYKIGRKVIWKSKSKKRDKS